MARPRMPSSFVVIAYDATKDHGLDELMLAVSGVLKGGDILCRGDTIIVLGVLHSFTHPMGYRTIPCPNLVGSIRAVEEAVKRKVDRYINMLLQSAEQCEDQGVIIKVKVTAGFPIKQVILQEIMACNAAWVVLDRQLRGYLEFSLTHIPCKIALIEDSLDVEVVRCHTIDDTDTIEHKKFYSLSKRVPVLNCRIVGNNKPSIISCRMYSVSIGSLEKSTNLRKSRPRKGFPAASCKVAEPEKIAHGRTSTTSASANRDRLVEKERNEARGRNIHLLIDHCFCCNIARDSRA